jgi:hypothetical protein
MVAGLVVSQRRDEAPVHIDVIGVGASPYDTLRGMDMHVLGINVSEKDLGTDKSGRLRFLNQRSGAVVALPRDARPGERPGRRAAARTRTCASSCARRSGRVQGLVIKVAKPRRDLREDQALGRPRDRRHPRSHRHAEAPEAHGAHKPGQGREHDPYASLAS